MLEAGTLWTKVRERTEHALNCGALLSIPTDYEFVEQDGVSFLVRILSNLARKDEAKQKQKKETANSGKDFNPFLPYDEDLFVADLSHTHVCIFNKFNVVDYHLLIITREFEEQESWLTLADFEAMWACLAEIDGLAFYNGGKVAGASQRHKHLQLVPLPLVPNGVQIPIAPLLEKAEFKDSIGTIPGLPFRHAFVQFDSNWMQSPLSAAEVTLECYRSLLETLGLNNGDQPGAYNLLATRKWMLIVPRSQEEFESISVNSLGFAGALLVRNSEQMKLLKDWGPMTILHKVAVSILQRSIQ
ncbi:MAG TPA: phosphorylase [Cyanobacteria bacterium UBA11372]|nr:phosphorylase [Cyanobacteria bacterium UBA11372]